MRQMTVMAALVIGAGVMSAAAQGRNFSGTWVIDAERTAAAAPAGGTGGDMIAMGGGGGGAAVATRSVAGGGGGAVMSGGGAGGAMVAGGGTRAVAAGSIETIITLDASTFAIDVNGVKTSYPTNGTETTVEVRGMPGRATAQWQGDVLTVTTTIDADNGPITSSQSWSLEGDSLVCETTRKTYYKRK